MEKKPNNINQKAVNEARRYVELNNQDNTLHPERQQGMFEGYEAAYLDSFQKQQESDAEFTNIVLEAKTKAIQERDKRISELTEQMNLLRMDSRDTIDTQNVIIFDQTNRIKELEKEVHRLQFSL